MYQLYGSFTSPFVRRLRIYLKDMDFEFLPVTLDKDMELILSQSPIGKIPFLKDGNEVIWDSRQIFEYVRKKTGQKSLTIKEENWLTLVSELNDSLVILFYMKKDGLDLPENVYLKKQKDRVQRLLNYTEENANEVTREWNFVSISLFCLLDWASFRELISFKNYPNLLKFTEKYRNNEEISKSHPSKIV